MLTPDRRAILQWVIGLSALAVEPSFSKSLTYPSRPVRLILGFAPGGAGDALARIVASALSERLGETVVVEYRPGAGSNLATRAMLSSPTDGHTLLLMGSSTVVSALLHEQTRPALLRDIEPVVALARSAFVIAVNSSAPQTTLADFVLGAKADRGKIRVGIYGFGTQSHLAAHSFCRRADIEVTLVPYGGSAPMVNDLLGKHIDVAFDSVGSARPHIKSGALRALAVTSAKPLDRVLPKIPAVSEFFPEYEVVSWTGLAVRKGTPLSIIERLHREGVAVLNDPIVGGRLAELTFDTIPCGREEFLEFWTKDIERTRTLIHDAGIALDYIHSK